MSIEISFSKPSVVLYNTEKRQKEKFQPKKNHVLIYCCGPTVYDFAHIGNFRTYVFEDLLRKSLKFFNYEVTQATNITDVDDKTIRGAIAKGCTLDEFTKPYKRAFFADLNDLGIERSEIYPEATAHIKHMVDMIERLIDKKVAYQSEDGSIYFSIKHFKKYGRLSHLKLEELKENASDRLLEDDEYEKESIGDFVLWKAYDEQRDGQIFWNSPFGKGRPGWHIECSAMAIEALGPTIDLHLGAVDNIFPHHENEIAQSEACTNHLFVRHWVHAEHLIVDGKKMSKSANNFYTLRDLLEKGYHGHEIRYLLMSVHYRTLLNFTFEALDAARKAVTRINDFIARLQESYPDAQKATTEVEVLELCQTALDHFSSSLADDLNISEALAALFNLMHPIHTLIDANQFTAQDGKTVLFVLQEMNRILHIMNFDQEEIPKELELLLTKREEARAAKNWQLSDQYREKILEQGYVIEDTSKGPRLKKKSSVSL